MTKNAPPPEKTAAAAKESPHGKRYGYQFLHLGCIFGYVVSAVLVWEGIDRALALARYRYWYMPSFAACIAFFLLAATSLCGTVLFAAPIVRSRRYMVFFWIVSALCIAASAALIFYALRASYGTQAYYFPTG